jgi:hypothetical protein
MLMRLCRLVREFWVHGSRRPAGRTGQRLRPVRASVECLEDRLTPAIYTNFGSLKGDASPSKEAPKEHWIEINSLQFGTGRGVSTPVSVSPIDAGDRLTENISLHFGKVSVHSSGQGGKTGGKNQPPVTWGLTTAKAV